MYLFDASAIFLGYKRGLEDVLAEGYTINLAFFEVGNIIWKEVFVYKSISISEALEVLEVLSEIFGLMTIINVNMLEKGILKIASKLGITYYDASYVYVAWKRDLTLVTEDKKLIRAIKSKIKLNAISLSSIKK